MAKPTNCGPKSLGWPMVPIHHYLCGGLSVVSRALICVFGFSCSAYFALFFSQNKSNLKCTCNIFVSQQTYYTNLPISAKRRRKPAIQQTALWINKSSRRANHAQERPRQSPNNSCAGNRRAKGMHMLLCRVDIYVYGASTTVSPRRLFSLSHLQNSSEAISIRPAEFQSHHQFPRLRRIVVFGTLPPCVSSLACSREKGMEMHQIS
jgi:hypothetical protein